MSLNRLIGAPLMAAAFPRIIRIVVGNVGNVAHHNHNDNGNDNNHIQQNIAININNININNNNNNNNDPTDVSLFHVRTRLFRLLFFKIAIVYALAVPIRIRKIIEWSMLLMAFLSLLVLCHLHVTFIQTPINCLDHIQNEWPRDGILRVQILSDPHETTIGMDTTDTSDHSSQVFQNQSISLELNLKPENSLTSSDNIEGKGGKRESTHIPKTKRLLDKSPVNSEEDLSSSDNYFYSNLSSFGVKDLIDYSNQINNNNENNGYPQPLRDKVSQLQMIARAVWPHDSYIIEYSLEYGFLRLSAHSRQRLHIPIKVVTLDPHNNRCFGDVFSRTLLSNFLGYDDILMGSLKNLAEKENNRGYVRNVITGEHYRFVNIWMTRASYIPAAFIMLVFTLSISMLLRYSHHQVFVFVAQLMHSLESNMHLTFQTFPAAPLLTVILALVGMEAIMSEFFNDTTTAFYVILIVWLADQFDAMCSHTALTRRHWLKFFYLYHFAFYAYNYRFNGQYSGLALLTSWLFTQHSMIYFFHSYELPHILSQTHPITIEATVRAHSPQPPTDPQPESSNTTNPPFEEQSNNGDDDSNAPTDQSNRESETTTDPQLDSLSGNCLSNSTSNESILSLNSNLNNNNNNNNNININDINSNDLNFKQIINGLSNESEIVRSESPAFEVLSTSIVRSSTNPKQMDFKNNLFNFYQISDQILNSF